MSVFNSKWAGDTETQSAGLSGLHFPFSCCDSSSSCLFFFPCHQFSWMDLPRCSQSAESLTQLRYCVWSVLKPEKKTLILSHFQRLSCRVCAEMWEFLFVLWNATGVRQSAHFVSPSHCFVVTNVTPSLRSLSASISRRRSLELGRRGRPKTQSYQFCKSDLLQNVMGSTLAHMPHTPNKFRENCASSSFFNPADKQTNQRKDELLGGGDKRAQML